MSVLRLVKLMHVLYAKTVSTSCRLAKYNALLVNLAGSVIATPMHHNSAQAANRTPFRTPKDSVRVSLVVLAGTQPVQWRRRRVLLRLRLLQRHRRQRPRHQRQLRTPRHKLARVPLVVAKVRFAWPTLVRQTASVSLAQLDASKECILMRQIGPKSDVDPALRTHLRPIQVEYNATFVHPTRGLLVQQGRPRALLGPLLHQLLRLLLHQHPRLPQHQRRIRAIIQDGAAHTRARMVVFASRAKFVTPVQQLSRADACQASREHVATAVSGHRSYQQYRV